MWITLPEAVEIYARFFQSRYGAAASQVARRKAQQLEAKGDQQGCQAWNGVAQQIEQLSVVRPSRSSRA